MRQLVRHRLVALLAALLSRRRVRRLVGRLNRDGRLIAGVFLGYPYTEDYITHYVPHRRLDAIRFEPTFLGLMRQDGRFIIEMGVSATERTLRRPTNADRLAELVATVERLGHELGAPQVSFAGVLPGLLERRDVRPDPVEPQVTASVVLSAVEHLIDDLRVCERRTPVVVLGARGTIGARVLEGLKGAVHGVDQFDEIPEALRGRPTLVINCASRAALRQRASQLWPGCLVLNEAYPLPGPDTIEALSRSGVALFHLVGVVGSAWPSLPNEYAGAIPCCAAWDAPGLKTVVRRIA